MFVISVERSVSPSKAELASYMKSHDSKLSETRFTKELQQQPISNSSQFSYKAFGSTESLRNHMKVHRSNVNEKNKQTVNSFVTHAIGLARV